MTIGSLVGIVGLGLRFLRGNDGHHGLAEDDGDDRQLMCETTVIGWSPY